ncbi:MAG: Ycf48-like protein [Fimbriimonadaceae bacterium]|nr:Ycf48-like protein [Fimbriimonadaceae bacterium]
MPLYRVEGGNGPQWVEIGPRTIRSGWGGMDNAGRMTAIVVHPHSRQIVYAAAASGGIWKSEDFCRTWRPIADDLASLSYGALAIDPTNPQVMYAGTGEPHYSFDSFPGVGIHRTRNGGETWELIGSETFAGHCFTRLICHPSRPGFIYASTTGGVYRSTDGGARWVRLLSGAASDLIIDPRSPDTLIAALGVPWGSPVNGLYKTRDAGQQWTRLTKELPANGWQMGRIQMDLCRAYPNVVYASVYGSFGALIGIYRSSDFGESWLRLPNALDYGGGQAWYDNYLTVSPTNPNVVFAGGTSTFRTVDGGASWEDNTRSYAGGPVHPDHHTMTFDPHDTQTVYMGGDGGIFRSRDLGGTWESVSAGLGTVQFQYVDVHPTDSSIAYGGTQDNGTNKFTGSQDWNHIFSGDGGVTRVNWKQPEVVYTEYVNLSIFKSNDGGRSWRYAVNGIDLGEGALFYAPYNLDPSNPDILVAGTQSVWRSTDGADSWKRASPPLGGLVSAISIAPNNSAVIYAGTTSGAVWVTADTGKTWFDITARLPRAYIGDFAIDPRNARHVYMTQVGWGGNRIWETTDAGATWTAMGDGLPGVPIRAAALHPRNPETIFLGTEMGVYISTEGGRNWRRFGSGLPNAPVFSLVVNGVTGYVTVGTHGRGAWRARLP